MRRVASALLAASTLALPARAAEPAAAEAGTARKLAAIEVSSREDPAAQARLGAGLMALGGLLGTGTMIAYQFLGAEPVLDDGEQDPLFPEDGLLHREQTTGFVGVVGGALGVVLLLTGAAVVLAHAPAIAEGPGEEASGEDAAVAGAEPRAVR